MTMCGSGGKGMPMWKSMPPAWEEVIAPSNTADSTRILFIRGNRRRIHPGLHGGAID